MNAAWRKNNRRELTKTLGRYLAILAIIALGVGFFAGLMVTQTAMLRTLDAYIARTELYDYRLLSTLGITGEDEAYFASLEGISVAEGSNSVDFSGEVDGREMTVRAITLTERINAPELTDGRLPERTDECLADNRRFSAEDIGKTITVTRTETDGALTVAECTIVGLCSSPLYINTERGTTNLAGGTLDAFVCLPREAFSAEYFTELYLKVDGADGAAYSDEYNQSVENMRTTLTQALDERATLRYEGVIGEAQAQLADAQVEYDKGVAEYQSERADAEKQLAEAKQALEDGAAEIERNTSALYTAQNEIDAAQAEYEAGLPEYEAGAAAFAQARDEAYAQLDAAQAELDANQAQIDSGMAQINDSGILVQHEALLVTLRQLRERMATLEPDSAEYLACQSLCDATQFLIDQFEQNEGYQAYLQLQDAQAQIDAAQTELNTQRAAAETELAQKQAELDAAKQALDDAAAQIASGRQEIRSGWAAIEAAQETLDAGQADYDAAYAEAQSGFAEAETQLEEGKQALEDAQIEVEKIENPSTYLLDRSTNSGYVSFENDSSIVLGISRVFPFFFFLVAVLVCITTMTRMIEEQRTQIGTLKAIGYGDGAIAWKFISYSGSAAMLGCISGFLLGTWVFPLAIWKTFSMLYGFADLVYVFDWRLAVLSVAVSMLCSAGATYLACRSELRRMPAALMRPRAPKAGKRILLEHLPGWRHIPFLYKVSLRNILRYKKRLFMMLLGIGGCTALIVTGFGLRDSISTIVDDQFDSITLYDMVVTFSTPMTQERQEDFRSAYANEMSHCIFVETAAYDIVTDDGIRTLNIVATDDADIEAAIGLHLDGQELPYPAQGAVIDKQLAESLGLEVGDTLEVTAGKTVEIPIVGIFENYVYHYAYMTAGSYEALFGEDCAYETAYVLTESDAYALGASMSEQGRVAAVTVIDNLRTQVDSSMQSLNAIVVLVIACACALALVVLYNLCNISLTERVREIATVKVLGFYPSETQSYVFREILMLAILGALLGLPAGSALHQFVMEQIKMDFVAFNVHIFPQSYAYALVITFALTFFVYLILRPKIEKIPMAESLKAVE